MPDEKIQPQEIVFPNNNGAKLVAAWRGVPMASLIVGETFSLWPLVGG